MKFSTNTSSLLKNVSILMSGNIVTSIASAISTIILARAVGVSEFGVFALLVSYIAIIQRVFDFQVWQSMIKFSSGMINNEVIGHIIKLSLILEVLSSLGAFFIGITLASFFVSYLNLNEHYHLLVMVYSVVLLFRSNGVAIGIFRLAENYKTVSKIQVFSSLIKVVFAMLGWLLQLEFAYFLSIWIICDILLSVLLKYYSYKIYKAEGLTISNLKNNKLFKTKEYLKFCVLTNLGATVDLPSKELDVFMVGTLASVEAAGTYRLCKQIMSLVGNISNPVYQVIYPQLAKMISINNLSYVIRYTFKVSIFLFIIGFTIYICVGATTKLWVPLVLGEKYIDTTLVIGIAVLYKGLDMTFTALHALFIALGMVKENLLIITFCNLILLLVAYLSIPYLGVLGAIISLGIQSIMVLLFKFGTIYSKRSCYA